MVVSLRPHHFLCLQGYKGFNYSAHQVNSWNRITKLLKDNPDTDVLTVSGSDDLCAKCPALMGTKSRCIEKNVKSLDDKVKDLLGLVIGKIYKYSDVVKDLNAKMTKEIHSQLCSGCMWWKRGLCRDSFKQTT